MRTPDSLRPGDLVGPWRVEGYAGRGAYGAVYRARRAGQPDSEPVALKIAVFPSDPRFGREVALLSRHPHPGIPRLLDQGVWHASAEVEHPYFVMEWIRGRPLYEWARMHNPTCHEVLSVIAQVAWTLEVLHTGECLHRDVKGDNMLVEAGGRVVLTDFGSGTWKGAPPLTQWLVPPNTREYRSPESLSFEWKHWETKGASYETRPADDLYALGVTAYRLVTGVYPPPGTAPEELKEQLKEPLPRRRPAHEFNRRVAPELSALIERMLAKEPEARGTAREIAQAAESAAKHARPEANVPCLDLEWPEARAPAVPVRRMPVPERMESGDRSWELRNVFLTAAMVLTVAGLCCLSLLSSPEPPQVVDAEALGVEIAPDAGTKGLGEDAVTARVETSEVPRILEAISRKIPDTPLPGQRRPPCRYNGELVIKGGCWKQLADSTPPCDDGAYEWQGSCFDPSWDRTRPPTSNQPH